MTEITSGDASEANHEELVKLASVHLRTLRDLLRTCDTRISAEDTWTMFVVAFTWKQEDHVDAILTLGKHRDVQLVARSMIEGLCQLKWAANDPEPRAERWRQFRWVHDWRLMHRRLGAGEEIPQSTKLRIENGIKQYGELFKTDRARRQEAKGKVLPDPYDRHWSGKSVAQVCAAVDGEDLYRWGYSEFSDWHHWSPGGVVRAFKADGKRITFPQPEAKDVLPAYTVAFRCLYETIELANNKFGLGLEPRLLEIRDAYARDLKPPVN